MGKKRKQKHHGGTRDYKQKHHQRFWIEDCADLVDDSVVLDDVPRSTYLVISITASHLHDDFLRQLVVMRSNATNNNTKSIEVLDKTVQATGTDPQLPFTICGGAMVRTTKETATFPPMIYIQRSTVVVSAPATVEPPTQTTTHTHLRRPTRDFQYLPQGNNGDGIVNPNTNVPHKYWSQRKRLFTKFDEGIQLDADGWFSVTPEVIANHIAHRMLMTKCGNATEKDITSTTTTSRLSMDSPHDEPKGYIVLDAFAGVGGNAIAFALRSNVALVVCVDTSLERLRLAAHNCSVYNVPVDKVLFVHGNACQVLQRYQQGVLLSSSSTTKSSSGGGGGANDECANETNTTIPNNDKTPDAKKYSDYIFGGLDSLPRRLDAIFLSPPWGGTEYKSIGPRHFGLSHIELLDEPSSSDGIINIQNSKSIDGAGLLQMAVAAMPMDRLRIAYYLPRNLNGLTFAEQCYACDIRGCVEMEQNIMNGKLKTVTVYIVTS